MKFYILSFVLLCLVALSWTASFFVLVRQMTVGYAFYMDGSGIHQTATAVTVLAFIFVSPVKRIPYNAIIETDAQNGVLTLKLGKSKMEIFPVFKPFVRKEYHFFFGFTKEKQSEIKQALARLMKAADVG